MTILLVSTYEMGHQPLGLAAPAAALRARGHEVQCLDLAVESLSPEHLQEVHLLAISIPMHTAARLGAELARRVRRLNPQAHIAFYGLYAAPLHGPLTASGLADSVIGGEYETGLVALADRLALGPRGGTCPLPGVGASPRFDRQQYLTPDRGGLAPLDRYARLSYNGELRLAGYVEATRGCAHRCSHCPLTPVYGGRLRLVQPETVLADIDQLVEMGAQHITFGDPDFLNAVAHSLAIVEALHRRHAGVTFDVTTKVEHLIEHEALLSRLRELGCLFITSAFESTNGEVLRRLQKGHTRADLDYVIQAAAREALVIRPTWMAFTPWTTLQDVVDLLAFVEEHGLVGHVQPVQYGLRLLLPPGSPLVEIIDRRGLLGPFNDNGLTYSWTNPDPRVDALQAEVAEIAKAASATTHGRAEPPEVTFAQVKRAVLRAHTGKDAPPVVIRPQPRTCVPGLTESWFC